MEMFRRIFFAAVLAGIVAGLALAAIQQWRVVPLILQAETYEISDTHAIEHAQDAAPLAPHIHQVEKEDLFGRGALTVLATVLAGLGFALVTGAVSLLAGIEITTKNGLLWGLAGFLTFSLMPAIGLPPEPPGMVAADLFSRQMWWVQTVLATGGAILLIAKMRNAAAVAIGIALILIPHIIGAPVPPDVPSNVPAHLALLYVSNALFSTMAFWLILGFAYGWGNQHIFKQEGS
ncbi:Predicted cobalt transporter CbtA [hydrothermal vent metagenome]|uniref:Predicted cobalt transporter CbtA n=1 Tax=hydrothermal vent metagenome TaxID=652676 RepID=A0A3B0TTW7_9ZZZZ